MRSSVTVDEAAPGYTIYRIDHPQCRATVARHGAQVMEWAPAGSGPVLYRSPRALLQAGKVLRGGIPICWPWFANHPTDPAMPSHGFVRNRFWNLDAITEDAAGVELRFSLEDDEETARLWPQRFRLEVVASLGAVLSVRLRCVNRGTTAFLMGGALHSYFAVGALERTRIAGLEDSPYFDKTGGREEAATGEALVVEGEVDSVYQSREPVGILDAELRRQVRIESSGHGSTVVWNPGAAKAAAMADLPAEDYRRFVAIEAALPPGKEVTLRPGEEHSMETRIRVSDFGGTTTDG